MFFTHGAWGRLGSEGCWGILSNHTLSSQGDQGSTASPTPPLPWVLGDPPSLLSRPLFLGAWGTGRLWRPFQLYWTQLQASGVEMGVWTWVVRVALPLAMSILLR